MDVLVIIASVLMLLGLAWCGWVVLDPNPRGSGTVHNILFMGGLGVIILGMALCVGAGAWAGAARLGLL